MPQSANKAARMGSRTLGEPCDDYPAPSLREQLALARQSRETAKAKALRRWADKIGIDARDASWLSSRREPLGAGVESDAPRRFMTGEGKISALDVEPLPWLRMTETQITRPMADFLNNGGPARTAAFLRALPCAGVELPAAFDTSLARAEVTAVGGRVDLLVTGRTGSRTFGAAIEVKIDSGLKNPLGAYAAVARDAGLAVEGRSKGRPTGALVVLARSSKKSTRQRLSRNKGWKFVHWSGFLRRFERELATGADDEDFRAFRRHIWDRFT